MKIPKNQYLDILIQKWLHSPFSNKVTKALIFTGAAISAAPLIEHLILKVILLKIFNIDIPVDVPDTPAYIAGVTLMALGALHNILFLAIELKKSHTSFEERKEKEKLEVPHDKKIIETILSKLPYENTIYWVEQSPIVGLRKDFSADLEFCERFLTPPFVLYNKEIESKKVLLIQSLEAYNSKCAEFLGAQEDPTGPMYRPPYHWKGYGDERENRYYQMQSALADAGQAFLDNYNIFIACIKSEGFVFEEI
ncbi:hypothetical protein ACF8PU_19355 [Pseudomonas sp. GLN_6]|uniref:hypothetical protein n=1 Tax=Pseudomonas sp. GLN_6 TaxID=3367183 RepID=UPI00370CD882